MYAKLGGEPWCFAPPVIAKLTDFVIEEVYFKPHDRRMELARRETQGLPPPPGAESGPDMFADGLPSREQFVVNMRACEGGSVAHWSAIYDRLLAEQERTGIRPA